MRFQKTPHHPFTDTSRKRAHVLRRQKAKQEALPLFAEQVAAEQPDVDEVMTERAHRWAKAEALHRQFIARSWREVRRKFYSLDEPTRRGVFTAWQAWRGPTMPTYLAHLIRQAVTSPPAELDAIEMKG